MSTQNGSNWRGIFGSFLIGFLLLIGLAGTANAAPTCKMQVAGDNVTIAIADTGMVASGGQSLPAGMTTYPGTGRQGDVSASCSDNAEACKSATWFLRFDQSAAGYPSDNDLGSDQRAVACSYDPQGRAQVCSFKLADGMKTAKGEVQMHFSAKLPNGQVVAAYQPQSGCVVEKDGRGNPHVIVSASAAN